MNINIDAATIYEMKNILDYLESHNKNYTNAQYYKIVELKEIVNNFVVENRRNYHD